jgi:hypothetical protein
VNPSVISNFNVPQERARERERERERERKKERKKERSPLPEILKP